MMMNKKVLGSAALAMLVGIGGAAIAQQSSNTTEQITVIASYITHQKARATAKGTVYTVQSTISTVSYADLDLSKASDGTVLKKRVSDAAKSLCDQLKAKYPETVYVPVTSADCAKTATNEAMETVNLLIFAYSGH